ncbi:hypothetical protein ACUY28_06475 [Corynebacterium sanguinis]|uniref:Uncharacterized protein n=1 Tax=Corynebacterium sanguinis TaxID=2594913 RepID=A0A838WUX3_9CORY|nr:hypothetical protein [Corynebacterium sanguinis]MBA4505679.1 hypothetical protein [Corynebacterium sanguinis]MCT1413171.1 hypothetical protein [Corynebacterium sanguinis]MCT1555425.1 hypothetical protein [Corynebacterium sanguinis]MCT1596408.1 hypothetical protein [Corynebacterium sanguinis]MCT2153537.1 hypothetical protein [Corynebacterium sanguinis]
MPQEFSVASGMWVLISFLIAGLLLGGVWSTYQSGSKVATVVLAIAAAVALCVAVLSMLGTVG